MTLQTLPSCHHADGDGGCVGCMALDPTCLRAMAMNAPMPLDSGVLALSQNGYGS